MSVFDTIRIAASGLTAERLRMDVAASNIANAQTTQTQNGQAGQPYQEEEVVFQPRRWVRWPRLRESPRWPSSSRPSLALASTTRATRTPTQQVSSTIPMSMWPLRCPT